MLSKYISYFIKKFLPNRYAKSIGVLIGENCRLLGCEYGSEPYLIKIGNHVSATKVRFETHDGGIWVGRDKFPEIDRVQPITIGDNVFIGYGAIILPGITIGNNVVIGACSVVTRNLESGYVYAGVPAKRIKSVDEYIENAVKNGDPTKSMNPGQKKSYYMNKYFN